MTNREIKMMKDRANDYKQMMQDVEKMLGKDCEAYRKYLARWSALVELAEDFGINLRSK